MNPSDNPQPVSVFAGEERLAGIIASAMDAVITIDADQRIVLFNPSAERIFGVPSDRALGQSLDRFMPDRFRDAPYAATSPQDGDARALAGHAEQVRRSLAGLDEARP